MKTHRIRCRQMGSDFELGVIHHSSKIANEILQSGIAEIQRIEALLTEFKPDSITSQVNREAGQHPVEVPAEFFSLMERCQALHRMTMGNFDITVRPLKKLYSFQNQHFEMPSPSSVTRALESVGTDKIKLNKEKQTVSFEHPAMEIGFAAIGKGYASERVATLWKKEGVESAYVNASGDLKAFGLTEKGENWKIGIANPDQPGQPLFYIPLSNAAAATSGDYEQFFMHQNIRYSHNIDPKTGFPLKGMKSVTVLSPSAELSDALATALYVMGPEKGMHFVQHLPETHCIMVDDRNHIFFSKQLEYEEVHS